MVPGIIGHMARCTAPVRGHRTASAAADCPACGGRYGRYSGYSSYGSYSSPSYSSSGSSGGGRSSGGGSGSSARPRWSRAGSSVAYTPAEVRALTPVRDSVEKRAPLPDLRDVFLCHAWDDRSRGRQGTARSARVTRCLGLVQREGRRPRHTVARYSGHAAWPWRSARRIATSLRHSFNYALRSHGWNNSRELVIGGIEQSTELSYGPFPSSIHH